MRSRLLSRRQSILNIFQTTLATSMGGLWLGSAKAQVDKLTTKDIQQAFARNLQPERMVTVILGAQP